jgi:hypothetical protein
MTVIENEEVQEARIGVDLTDRIFNRDLLNEILNLINENDELTAALRGSPDVGKRAVIRRILDEKRETLGEYDGSEAVDSLREFEGDIELLIAYIETIKSAIDKAFGERIDAHVSAEAEAAQKKVEEGTSAEDLDAELKKAWFVGEKLREQFDAVVNVLKMTGQLSEDQAKAIQPKRVYKAQTKGVARGPRLSKSYLYFIDGKQRTDTQNSLASVANTECKEITDESGNPWKTKHLKDWMSDPTAQAQNEFGPFDFENPPDEWMGTLPAPSNKTMRMVVSASTEEYEVEEEEEEETEEVSA